MSHEYLSKFVDIPNMGGVYQINKLSQVKRVGGYVYNPMQPQIYIKEKIRKPHLSKQTGYWTVHLSINGMSKVCLIHRLMAETFLPNPENKKTVNHKNSIRSDNRLENLEWATNSENQKHAFRYGGQKCHNASLVLDTETGIFFDSIKKAADAKSIENWDLFSMLKGATKNRSSMILV